MMSKTKAHHNLLARFRALSYDARTGGELTVRTNPQPSRAVRMPDPYSAQEVVTSLCETIHAVQAQNRALEERLAALEQGKFAATGQPATLTVTVLGGQSQAPAPTRPQSHNVRPCPMVQTDTTSHGSTQHGSRCPLVHVGNGGWW